MLHILVSGDVQGVGFRQFVKYNAKKLNIKGWIKNLDNKKVEGILQGDTEDLEKLVLLCKKGPFLANVENVEIEELPDENFESFEILKD